MQHLEYLFAIFLFLGPAMLVIWRLNARLLKKYEIVLIVLTTISTIGSLTEYYALKWGAWAYFANHTLNLRFYAEIESFVFSACIILSVGMVTLVGASLIDKKQLKHPSKKRYSKKNGSIKKYRSTLAK